MRIERVDTIHRSLEVGAAAEGMSLNTFIVRVLERNSSNRSRSNRVGNRLHGYGTT